MDVAARFADRRPEPDPAWLFRYDIAITNESEEMVQLLSRHWVIEHGEGQLEEVRGPGVVVGSPLSRPGRVLSLLLMVSTARALRLDARLLPDGDPRGGNRFKVEIAQFTLSEPVTLH